MDDSLLLTVEGAARRLELSRASVYALVTAGEIESIKIGRARRVPVAALEEFVARKRQSTARESIPTGS